MFGLSELAIILIVVIAVLAAKKLPDLARSAGKSARILKAEARAIKEEEQGTAREQTAPRVIPGETSTPGTPPTDAPQSTPRPGGEAPPRAQS
ncbi:twin-arginine translocase TatA/TatE family subunit [Streptomyces albicerus]|uniref:twin-arginine translocase TatA/TatE family subunit n=1 Tax=Streptomyces albicerus TaxID=2569859 RepID=UPI00124AEB21|nr:twin-arginine translocase TatA/TatE family subunit [Streptomyces albicerus]